MKTGLFFGSFNPVHIGHLALANYMLEFTDLQKIWFIVSPHNPLKEKKTLLADRQRLEMVRLAIGDNSRMRASDIEFQLPQPSYTVNTLAHLREKYPAQEFSLILGSDNIESLHKWKNYEYLLANHDLYVYPRPGYAGGDLRTHARVKWVDAPLMEISSTFIREGIRNKKDLRHFVPEAAWNYLREMHFYEK
ncbi:MAG: nicotinate (nicotinamide) nucleotide adenylyltransferase [Bacteroidia bacterium]